jgi:hypothetical protein
MSLRRCLRDAIPKLLVNFMALAWMDNREVWIIVCACALWREFFDILECFIDYNAGDKDALKKIFFGAPIPRGKFGNPFPPLMRFPPYAFLMVGNIVGLVLVLLADGERKF